MSAGEPTVLRHGLRIGGYVVGWLKGARLRMPLAARPTLRFRGKVLLGFGCLVVVSAISMGAAYFGLSALRAASPLIRLAFPNRTPRAISTGT